MAKLTFKNCTVIDEIGNPASENIQTILKGSSGEEDPDPDPKKSPRRDSVSGNFPLMILAICVPILPTVSLVLASILYSTQFPTLCKLIAIVLSAIGTCMWIPCVCVYRYFSRNGKRNGKFDDVTIGSIIIVIAAALGIVSLTLVFF